MRKIWFKGKLVTGMECLLTIITTYITCILCCRFIPTATDLFIKWDVAKPLCTKTAVEVSGKVVNILLDFGLVDRIITDQGRKFVNEVQLCL